LFYKGTSSGEKFKIVADSCLPIRPTITLTPPEGLSKYFFDINLMRDMGVHLQLSRTETSGQQQPQTPGQSVVKKKCYKCKKMLPWSDMRMHIGVHILKNDIIGNNICGFCGRVDTCEVTMKASSKKGPKKIYTIEESDCHYTYTYGRSKKFNKKTNPCTNRVERCPIESCLSNVWNYNFLEHLEDKHVGVECPEELKISEAEKKHLLK
jgi:hypothetical protein